MRTNFFQNDPTTLRRAASHAVAMGLPSAPLWLAAADGRIDMVLAAEPKAVWPGKDMERRPRPTIFLLSGDPGDTEPTYGPDEWACATEMKRWARLAIVHGSGGEVHHYEMAIGMAAMCDRLALIETTSALAKPWYQFLCPVPSLCILPPEGGQHPVAAGARH